MWNSKGMLLISVDDGLPGGGLGNSIASALVRVNTASGFGTMVVLSGREKYVASLGQDDLMCNGRELVEL